MVERTVIVSVLTKNRSNGMNSTASTKFENASDSGSSVGG
jgi:hypothetical protein